MFYYYTVSSKKMCSFRIVVFCLSVSIIGTSAQSHCTINLEEPLGSKTPIVLQNGDLIKVNNRNGDITIDIATKVQFLCSGARNYLISRNIRQLSNATCLFENKFLLESNNQIYSFSNIKCHQPPKPALQETGLCNLGAKLVEIGFEAPPNNFISKIQACFDPQSSITYWTRNILHTSPYSCATSDSTNFKKDLFPPGVDIDEIYKHHSQYDKGHLTAKCDFATGPEKRATFYYINSSPQFKEFNRINWRLLEDSVRKQVAVNNRYVTIYTGTYRTVSYLDNKIPVQQFFWKVVIERTSGNGIGFVGVNNLQQNIPSPCSTVSCDEMHWLSRDFRNRMKDISKGQIYCCKVQHLRQVPNIQLPPLVEFTGGLLTDL